MKRPLPVAQKAFPHDLAELDYVGHDEIGGRRIDFRQMPTMSSSSAAVAKLQPLRADLIDLNRPVRGRRRRNGPARGRGAAARTRELQAWIPVGRSIAHERFIMVLPRSERPGRMTPGVT